MPSAIPRMCTQGPAPARTPTPRAQPTDTRPVPPSLHCSRQALACAQQQRKVPGRNHHYDQRRPENLISNSKHEPTGRASVPWDSDVLWAWGAGAPTSQHPKPRRASQAGRQLTGAWISAGRGLRTDSVHLVKGHQEKCSHHLQVISTSNTVNIRVTTSTATRDRQAEVPVETFWDSPRPRAITAITA